VHDFGQLDDPSWAGISALQSKAHFQRSLGEVLGVCGVKQFGTREESTSQGLGARRRGLSCHRHRVVGQVVLDAAGTRVPSKELAGRGDL
jgi:hypothetical protein